MSLELKHPLPGKSAQLEMAPAHRIPSLLQEQPPAHAGRSAVLALLSPTNEGLTQEGLLDWELLLIQRNVYPGVHSGQIAFPGGQYEEQDGGFWETACRETREEVGIAPDFLEKITELTSVYVPPSNFIIYPFLAVNRALCPVRPDPREVAGYKHIPLRRFNPERAVTLEFPFRDGSMRPAPAWRYEDYTIWGATAMILAELYRIVTTGGLAPVENPPVRQHGRSI